MTPITLPALAPQRDRLFEPRGQTTLADVISKTLQSLAVRGSATCPVCGATLLPEDESTASCGRCGSTLA